MAIFEYLPSALYGVLSRVSSLQGNRQTLQKIPGELDIPQSHISPARGHPRLEEVAKQVDEYFLEHWPFPNERARKKFVSAGFSRVTCLYLPQALDDRIDFACRLLTVLFLIDDELENMSLDEGEAYNAKLMPVMRGDVLPDPKVPAERILYDVWESMRAHDREMADEILESVVDFMRAQTDRARMRPMGLGEYFQYRELDVGKALLGSLMRFSMALRMSPAELEAARPADMACSKHLSVINDIWSYDKELLASRTAYEEGGALCNCVAILAHEAELTAPAAKRVLYGMAREWERCYRDVSARVLARCDTPAMRAYLQGLEYQMSGNELWSRTTLRYLAPSG